MEITEKDNQLKTGVARIGNGNVNIFDELWGSSVVIGNDRAPEPPLLNFINISNALELLNKHVNSKSNIMIHCDVDVDGIGSGYITGRFLKAVYGLNPLYTINKTKEHGIQNKHIDYINNTGSINLLIIVDSSSLEIEIIKRAHCDVLVIDHHEVSGADLSGKTEDGHTYIIVNNVVDNLDTSGIKELYNRKTGNILDINPYNADDRMSCGVVLYEFFKVYSLVYGLGDIIKNMKLYQWSAVTLLTDAIPLNNLRNQWYIEHTMNIPDIEPTLKTIMTQLNSYNTTLNKSLINYTIAPVINKSIRAGFSTNVLDAVFNRPQYLLSILDLKSYEETQKKAIDNALEYCVEDTSYMYADITNLDISPNYCGVIASRMCGDHKKNAIVFRVIDGLAQGSFRGRNQQFNYMEVIDNFCEESWARGHKVACGFKCPIGRITEMMNKLSELDRSEKFDKYVCTMGTLNNSDKGIYKIIDFDSFKSMGGIWCLGVGNSRVSNDEQIQITINTSDLVLKHMQGKLFIYDMYGMECKAFKEISDSTANIYIEYTNKINIYLK